jgi:ubiquinone/menaquinone biosynthesis C-methylase UbiE
LDLSKLNPWSRYALPRIVHFSCSRKPNMRQREKVIPLAEGEVLELGFGSGLNMAYYDAAKVSKVWGLDPSAGMAALAARTIRDAAVEVELIGRPGDEIPLSDASIDTVVVTYTLCSIPITEPVLRQMARVLKPSGQLVFCEHGAAPDADVRRWQNRLDPLWSRCGGGCHLNREIPRLIEEGGFRIEGLETMYIPGWRPACFNYWGTAKPS